MAYAAPGGGAASGAGAAAGAAARTTGGGGAARSAPRFIGGGVDAAAAPAVARPRLSVPIPLTRRKASGPAPEPEPVVLLERRKKRVAVEVEVDFGSDHNFYVGLTSDISEGGLFVATHQPRKVGDLIDLRFSLPGRTGALQVAGRVRWLRGYDPGEPDVPPGMGVQFASLGEGERRAIVRFVRKRDPILYED